jgi:alpha-amylase
MNRSLIISMALFLLLASACTPKGGPTGEPVSPVTGLPQGTDGYTWWNDTVFYEIFVRSFYDSDGDGIGDFNGIIEKLDYLNDGDPDTGTDLGVTGIWLMPIFPSPSYHGYDVTDYYAVNPDYGTMEDFQRLLDETHARGIRVIIDMVLNHTSSEHPWFVEARRDPNSPKRDWYVWSDTDPGFPGPWGQDVWYPSIDGTYYYAMFWEGMPDLNYNNPEVTSEMDAVTRFWLDEVGVDGFRLDAARYLIEDGTVQADTPATHAWWENYRLVYKASNPDSFTIGEVWTDIGGMSEYVQGDELDMAFEFDLASALINSALKGSALSATGQLKLSTKLIPDMAFAPFLTNHDQERTTTLLNASVPKAQVAASMLLTAPGAPFIYYGEEVGMQGSKPDEDIRRPMQWSGQLYAGFTTGVPWRPPGTDWQIYNVAHETRDPDSLLSHYRNLIAIRNQHAALRVGETSVIRSTNSALYTILRTSQEETILAIINLSGSAVSNYSLSLDESPLESGTYRSYSLIGPDSLAKLAISSDGGFTDFTPLSKIQPYTTIILQLGK